MIQSFFVCYKGIVDVVECRKDQIWWKYGSFMNVYMYVAVWCCNGLLNANGRILV